MLSRHQSEIKDLCWSKYHDSLLPCREPALWRRRYQLSSGEDWEALFTISTFFRAFSKPLPSNSVKVVGNTMSIGCELRSEVGMAILTGTDEGRPQERVYSQSQSES